jgi:alpha-1,2-glucosyltransferase
LQLGGLAVLCRQTNVVWVIFIAGIVISTHASVHFQAKLQRAQANTSQQPWNPSFYLCLFSRLDIALVAWAVWRMVKHETRAVVLLLWPYASVCFAFVYFVLWNNGSIVLGHSQYHGASLHWAQLLYLLGALGCVTLLALVPTASGRHSISEHLKNLYEFVASPTRTQGPKQDALRVARIVLMCLPFVAGAVFGSRYSVRHPFLVSDNRHYSFYACSKFFCKYQWAPLLASVVASLAGGVAMSQLLRPGESVFRLHRAISVSSAKVSQASDSIALTQALPIWVQHAVAAGHPAVGRSHATMLSDMLRAAWSCGWLIACAAALVPSSLVEPRYFIVPFALWLMHARFTRRQLFILCIAFIVINFGTMVVFLHKPFESGSRRFMW